MDTSFKSLAISAALALSLLAASCSGGDDGSTPATSSPTPIDPVTDLVGSGCADYAASVPSGDGSLGAMVHELVSKALAANPFVDTFSGAVSGQVNAEVTIADRLDAGQFTVFAPVDEAFDKLGTATVARLGTPAGVALLDSILGYHLIEGRLVPADIDGTHRTIGGSTITVAGSGDDITVGNGQAHVVCGGIQTKNATIYLLDTVVTPPGT